MDRKQWSVNIIQRHGRVMIVAPIVFVVSAAWRRNRSNLACWGSFSSFLRPGGEIALNWPAGGGFRRFCGLAAKSL